MNVLRELQFHELAGSKQHRDCSGRLCPGPRAGMGWRCTKWQQNPPRASTHTATNPCAENAALLRRYRALQTAPIPALSASQGALLPPTKTASDSGDAGSDGRGCHGQCHPTPWLSSPGDPWHSTRLVAAEPVRGRIRSSAFGSPRMGALACDSRFS